MVNLFTSKDSINVQAYFLGQRIDLQSFHRSQPLAVDPLVVAMGDSGCAVLFAYGVVVILGLSAVENAKFFTDIQGLIVDPFTNPETESVVIQIAPVNAGKVEEGKILLPAFDLPRLQLVAAVLAKSVVLAEYETGAAQVFDQIEPFAASLQNRTFNRWRATDLLSQIGNSLMIQHKIVGRVEIVDKPELLWEYPEFDRLYDRLEDEYEIRERHLALERKLELVSHTAQTALDIQQGKIGLRLEWYVVILIVIEVFLSLYDLFVK